MITQEQGITAISGLNVFDGIIVSHMIDKLLQHGLVSGKELYVVAVLRAKIHNAVVTAAGIDLDNPQKEMESKDGQ